jgi:8-oxo-dGTP diphosphatase
METKHTRCAGGVVIGPDGRVAIVSQGGDSWSLPKGHIDAGEDALQAAVREIREETGLTYVDLIKSLGSYSRYKIGKGGLGEDVSELKMIEMFLFRTAQTDLKPVDAHNPEALWVEKQNVADLLTHPKDREFFLSVIHLI